jgi:IclR family acetate operon transcriptional repressor
MCAAQNVASTAETTGRYQVRAVTRALDVLLAFRELDPPVELGTLARHTGLHPSTALRYAESLRSRGLLRSLATGGYELGSPLFELATGYLRNLSVWSHATALAERLAAAVNETASVGVLDNGAVLYIAIANGQRELGIQSQPGTRHPAHCTALGKAMLADLDWEEVRAVLRAHPPARLTERTIIEAGRLRDELERVRRLGYAVDDEERSEGVVCLGAPIRDHTGRAVAAVSVSGPSFRMREAMADGLADTVTRMADEVGLRLGAMPASFLDGSTAGRGRQ